MTSSAPRWPVAVLGALIGATILLVTSAKVFDVIVPILVAGASILLHERSSMTNISPEPPPGNPS
jgi:hypothetical protein